MLCLTRRDFRQLPEFYAILTVAVAAFWLSVFNTEAKKAFFFRIKYNWRCTFWLFRRYGIHTKPIVDLYLLPLAYIRSDAGSGKTRGPYVRRGQFSPVVNHVNAAQRVIQCTLGLSKCVQTFWRLSLPYSLMLTLTCQSFSNSQWLKAFTLLCMSIRSTSDFSLLFWNLNWPVTDLSSFSSSLFASEMIEACSKWTIMSGVLVPTPRIIHFGHVVSFFRKIGREYLQGHVY